MKDRIRNNIHRGYTMPHKELMDDEQISYAALSELLKSRIRLFEQKHDKYLNNDGYLDEQEESLLLADSEKIRQELLIWLSEQKNAAQNGTVAAGVTLTLLGFIGLMFGIKNLRK